MGRLVCSHVLEEKKSDMNQFCKIFVSVPFWTYVSILIDSPKLKLSNVYEINF